MKFQKLLPFLLLVALIACVPNGSPTASSATPLAPTVAPAPPTNTPLSPTRAVAPPTPNAATATGTPTLEPTSTLTPTPSPLKWDIIPVYTQTISVTVRGSLPVRINLQSDLTRGGDIYALRRGWRNLKNQPADESLAEAWVRAIFEAWWYNGGQQGNPTAKDFGGYVDKWAQCLKTDPSGQGECWREIHLQVFANDLRNAKYTPKRMMIDPPTTGRIVLVGFSDSIKNMTRGIGQLRRAYGINYLDGVLIIYVGKSEYAMCTARPAAVTSEVALALSSLQVSAGVEEPKETLFVYVSREPLRGNRGAFDYNYILDEIANHENC